MIKKDKTPIEEQTRKFHLPFWQNIFRGFADIQDIDILNVLKKNPIFSQLTKKELLKVSFIIYERKYTQGEYLFREGNPGSAMFIIKNGTVSIERSTTPGTKDCLATLISGDFIGEISLIEDAERTANAKCTTNTTAIILFRHDLLDLIAREPILGNKIFKSLGIMVIKRLKETNDELIKCKMLCEAANNA